MADRAKIDITIKLWRITLAQISVTLTFTITAAQLAAGQTSFSGQVGQPISGSVAPTGGLPPDTVTIPDPTQLPPGVAVDSTGNVSGTPTQAGTFSVAATIADSQG
jgi:hypothetical protein